MGRYRRAVWVPKINERCFLFLSCNEYNYILRDYIGKNTQKGYFKEHKGPTRDLWSLILKTRPPINIPLNDPHAYDAWRNYLLEISMGLEKNQKHEPIQQKLIELIDRSKKRYKIILNALLKHEKCGHCIYEKMIVDHLPEDRFPQDCKNICVAGKVPLYKENGDHAKDSDICGIVNEKVRIIIEEEFITGGYKKYFDKLLSCKFMRAKDRIKRDLTNVILFIVENSVKPPGTPPPNKAFSHIIICNNEDFPEEYEKIKRYI